jgi:hypothetical protein
MLAAILELLLQLLAEILLQLFTEVLFELGFASLAHSLRRGRSANPILAGIGLCIVGSAAGFITCWVFPKPLVRPARLLPGLSLVVAPLATGAAMHVYGSWRRGRGGDPTLLATFWGGAIFAFAMGLARAVCITRT